MEKFAQACKDAWTYLLYAWAIISSFIVFMVLFVLSNLHWAFYIPIGIFYLVGFMSILGGLYLDWYLPRKRRKAKENSNDS